MNTRILPGRGKHQQRKYQQLRTEEGEGGSGSHTNSTQELSRNTTKILEKLLKTNNWTRTREKPQNLVHTEEQAPTQPAHTCTTEDKRWGTDWPSDNQLVGKTHQRKTQQEPKTKDMHRANRNCSPRSVRSGNQGDCTTKFHRYSTIEVYTTNPGVQNRAT